jgi:tetratricopeptide (TPR) repeat protein
MAYERLGDHERALADFRHALAISLADDSNKWSFEAARKRVAALAQLGDRAGKGI